MKKTHWSSYNNMKQHIRDINWIKIDYNIIKLIYKRMWCIFVLIYIKKIYKHVSSKKIRINIFNYLKFNKYRKNNRSKE